MTALQINVNLKDLFTEEETEDGYVEIGLADALKSCLIHEARQEVKKITDGILERILKSYFENRFEVICQEMAESYFNSFKESPEFKERYRTESLSSLIKGKLDRISFESKAESEIKRLSNLHVEEIKKTFDQRYAAGVVEGLNKHNLLNTKAADLLIGKSE